MPRCLDCGNDFIPQGIGDKMFYCNRCLREKEMLKLKKREIASSQSSTGRYKGNNVRVESLEEEISNLKNEKNAIYNENLSAQKIIQKMQEEITEIKVQLRHQRFQTKIIKNTLSGIMSHHTKAAKNISVNLLFSELEENEMCIIQGDEYLFQSIMFNLLKVISSESSWLFCDDSNTIIDYASELLSLADKEEMKSVHFYQDEKNINDFLSVIRDREVDCYIGEEKRLIPFGDFTHKIIIIVLNPEQLSIIPKKIEEDMIDRTREIKSLKNAGFDLKSYRIVRVATRLEQDAGFLI